MTENPDRPKEFDAVLGGQAPDPDGNAAVLGGLEGVKRRLASASVEQRIAQLKEAIEYGAPGLDLVIQALKDEAKQVRWAAYSLLCERSGQTPQTLAVDGYEQFLGLLLRLTPVADTYISSYASDRNYGDDRAKLSTGAWTISGQTNLIRGLLKFDIPSVPSEYKLLSARLFLFAETTIPMYGQGIYNSERLGHSQLSGSNEWLLSPILSPWSQDIVTWATQPRTALDNEILVPASRSPDQNYEYIDITCLVQSCLDTGVNYGFMMKLKTEAPYREVTFHSGKAENIALRPRLDLYYA
jgi:hypothetical protein